MRCKVMVARFPGRYYEDPRSADWAWETIIKAKADPRVESVHRLWKADTPITMTRNKAVKEALDLGVDVLVMVDSDMRPDCEPDGKPFWETSFDFWWEKGNVPMVIGAPYTGPPPHNNIYVFHYGNYNNYDPTLYNLPQYTRNEASRMAGISRCGALPTGVIMYCNLPKLMKRKPEDPGPGMPAVKDKGWFYYEWRDETCAEKASTEDVTNTRDIGLLLATSGIPGAGIYCNWDAWAAHIKPQEFGKPREMTAEDVGSVLKAAWAGGRERGEVTVEMDVHYPAIGGEEAA